MRFGLSFGAGRREEIRYIVDVAKYAEDLGFDAAYVIDSQLATKDAYTVLTAAALATSSIALGPGVTNPMTRDLTVIESAISGMDEVSDGRAFLGIGRGASAVTPIGMKAASVARMAEVIPTLRGLLRGDDVVYNGHRIRLPHPRPRVPIFVAGTAAGMLELAGRLGDGVIVQGFGGNTAILERQLDSVEEGIAASGRSRRDLLIDVWVTISVSADRGRARDDVRSWVFTQSASTLREMSSRGSLPPELATVLEPGEIDRYAHLYDIRDHLSVGAHQATTVRDALVDALTIAGPREYCAEKLVEVCELKPDRITLSLLSAERSEGGRQRRLDELAETVALVNRAQGTTR